MLNANTLFGNVYDKEEISDQHMLSHSEDHVERLTNCNTNGKYDSIIALLNPEIAAMAQELGNRDTSINIRMAKTDTIDLLTIGFSHTLSELEGVISYSCGGENSESYKEFFPRGLTEYNKPNRDNMDVFTDRITKATTKYSALLPPTVVTKLLALQPNYKASKSSQGKAKSDVSNSIIGISTNRQNLNLGMTESVRTIGKMYPGNVVPCIPLFNFNLLYPVTKHPHQVLTGTIAAGGMVEVINKLMSDTFTIIVKNLGTTASLWIWFGATATDVDNKMAIEIKPGKTVTLKPSDIGDLIKTFLLMKNDSGVNVANYEVTIIG